MDDPKESEKSTVSRLVRWGETVFGCVFAWAVVMGLIQRGIDGYLLVIAAMVVMVWALLVSEALGHWLWRHRVWVAALGVLIAWLLIAGSYAYLRDLLAIAVAMLAVLAGFREGRCWVVSCWDRLRGGKGQVERFPTRARFAVCWLLLCWVLISAGDGLFESTPIPRRGSVVVPPSMPDEWNGVRVGLALSGGGYRAAMVHAGVLDMLGKLGVPVTNLSAVSGGSIIGAFVAAGGSPEDFAEAVRNGRFRFTRDLTWTSNAFRLPAPARLPWLDIDLWPFGSYSRLDVQANLFDRVLLRGVRADDTASLQGPALMLSMTDLRYGFTMGLTSDGMFLLGPIAWDKVQQSREDKTLGNRSDLPPVFYRAGVSVKLEGMERLARQVAISGAFPGAFPTTELRVSVPVPQTSQFAPQQMDLALTLADGGIRDNLGLNVLELANLVSRLPGSGQGNRTWSGDAPDARWQLDVILVSDGGKALQAAEELSAVGSVFRAMDLNGLETGALRRMSYRGEPPIVLLSALASLSLSPDTITSGHSADELRDRPSIFLNAGLVGDAILESLAQLVPDRAAAQSLVHRFRAAPKGAYFGAREVKERCASNNPHVRASRACARYALESLIGADLWQVLSAFRSKPTLEEVFSDQQARDIFRFGQYLVLLKANDIRESLNNAAARKKASRIGG